MIGPRSGFGYAVVAQDSDAKPGAGGVWFTADDVVSSYTDYSNDTNGNQTRYASYSGAGTDGVWFTADDVVSYEATYSPSF